MFRDRFSTFFNSLMVENTVGISTVLMVIVLDEIAKK
jgi:hypothetical protein